MVFKLYNINDLFYFSLLLVTIVHLCIPITISERLFLTSNQTFKNSYLHVYNKFLSCMQMDLG